MTDKTALAIRGYRLQDLSPLVRLFTDSVHQLAASAYDETQRNAWASRTPHLDTWRARLESLETLIAEDGDQLAGFISYEPNGHIDLIFTTPNSARKGVASALYQEAEARLREAGVTSLFTEASVVARPFFERQGFSVESEQKVTVRGVHFLRYAMRKALQAPAR
ncbi:GNAT family N-acetyltransferase [Marinobacter sp. C2H3]|uniref:GNAT family N-acetyltransferase n=1 Tax=Marinobacter sp. C2H3 TaxID=3119003 RepID=UPI00300EC5D7